MPALSIKHNIFMAGAAGFEPAHPGTKNQCLTAWLRPNNVDIIIQLKNLSNKFSFI